MTNTIKRTFAVAFLIFLTCALIRAQDAPAPAQPAAAQSELLQGAWEGVEVGREALGKATMTITGNTLHFQGAIKEEWYKATFTLPAGTNPRQLAATITECSQPDFVGKPALAIFRIEDGKLTLSGYKPGVSEAPKSFEGDTAARTFVFKKVQAPSK